MTHANLFGMFIHWGIYALTELQDQAFARYDMPRGEYEALQRRFNPVNYDPEKWVLLAKEAGMKYICFTAKHHDGFCMWDTKHTDYSVMHTPYGKDVLKMLADACEKHGMLLSLYYSCPDWHHPDAWNPLSSHQWRSVRRENTDFEVYKTYVLNQITELLTDYGRIYTLFWDIPPMLRDPRFNELARRLQPGILINDRGFDEGDFSTPEREYTPDQGSRPFERMTEACNSIDAESWGYRAEPDFYTVRHLLTSIDRIMAKGGSYLLNIGPMADGSLHPDHAARIRRIGEWYVRMEGCLESPLPDACDYRVFRSGDWIAVRKGERTFFHFYNGLIANAVAIENYPCLPKRVRLMNTGEPLPFGERIMPGNFDPATGCGRRCLHITGIPADALASEPAVLEVEW